MRNAKNSDFELVKEVNTHSKRVNFRVNIGALFVIAVCVLITILTVKISFFELFSRQVFLKISVIIVTMLLYFPFHELLHALFYKAFTNEKIRLTLHSFALSSDCPTGVFRKWEYVCIAVMPCIVIFVVVMATVFRVPHDWVWLFIILGIENFSGAVSDFYVIYEVIKGPKRSLVNDDGSSLKFYARKKDE